MVQSCLLSTRGPPRSKAQGKIRYDKSPFVLSIPSIHDDGLEVKSND